MRRTVLITGASGFVGSALARQLVGQGCSVLGARRNASPASAAVPAELRWLRSPLVLDQPQTIASALREARSIAGGDFDIVHSAALISYRRRDRALQERTNVEGTRALLAAAEQHARGRFVFVSSVVAVGATRDPRQALDEDAPFDPALQACDYATTKRAAQELVLASAASRLDSLCVNPGAIFGPAARLSNTSKFLQRVGAGRCGPLIPPGSIAVVGVEDVAAGIALALARGRPGRAYLLVERSLRLAELFDLVETRLLGAPRRTPVAPPWLWSLVVAGATVFDRLRPAELATPQSLRLLGLHYRYGSDRARRELGWRPEGFELVLERTLRWLASLPPA